MLCRGHRAQSNPDTNSHVWHDSTYRRPPQRANPQRQKVGEWLPGLGEGAWGVVA